MNNVIACFHLLEDGIAAGHVCAQCIEDVPISVIITGRSFIAAVPHNSDRARHGAGGHPGKDGSISLRSIANTDARTPGVSFVLREPDENIVVIRIADVNGAVSGNFDRKEKMRVAGSSYVVHSVGNRREARCRRNANGDDTTTPADINGAVVLIDTNAAGLADGSRRRRVSVSQTTIRRALHL